MGFSQELIHGLDIPAVFTDFCEEAAHLAAQCLSTITERKLALPVCTLAHLRCFYIPKLEERLLKVVLYFCRFN